MRLRREKYLPSSGLILIVMGGLLAKKKNGELVPKCYLHYCYHGKERNPDAKSTPGSSMVSPQWQSRAPNHASLPALSSLWSEQKAAVTVASPGLFREKNVTFSQSPGVAFPLPQHSWDAKSQHKVLTPQPTPRGQALCPPAPRADACVRGGVRAR